MYQDKVFLSHSTNPEYRGWFHRIWFRHHGVSFLLHQDRVTNG
ncbi:hypothetical protein M2322_002680 [Rhodoblastus acidophilus]|nr:hypothetical protein [Rhodoblastus acidophilus]